ncbi:M12 family metallopeptidase [Chryseobacterium sp. KCF3-3]|uniref:M12 family metallopeptidase n=1 Tax=Chryseobacterium sp. KCF3-3 TaxID=3231511 RepID=UPI0038B3D89D
MKKKFLQIYLILAGLLILSCHEEAPTPTCSSTSVHDKAVNEFVTLWPGGIIPYQFSSNFPEGKKSIVTGAMDTWEALTKAIHFRPKNNNDTNYVTINWVSGNTCNSSLGSKVRGSNMNFSDYCRVSASYFHEIGHLIGMIHEHQRTDRYSSLSFDDATLEILAGEGGVSPSTIDAIVSQVHQMNTIAYLNNTIYPNAVVDIPFDKNSIMMYGSKLSNPSSSIFQYLTTKNLDLFKDKSCNTIAPPNTISNNDIRKVQLLYPKVFIIKNYTNINFNNIRVRLKDGHDFTQTIAPGATFILHYNPENGYYYYKDHNGEKIVQQLDFNNGSSSDDMNFEWGAANHITYRSNSNTITTIATGINNTPNNIITSDAIDSDGVNGSSSVRFKMSVGSFDDGNIKSPLAIICDLRNG